MFLPGAQIKRRRSLDLAILEKKTFSIQTEYMKHDIPKRIKSILGKNETNALSGGET